MVNTVFRVAAKRALRLTPSGVNIIQNATMMSRNTRGGPLKLEESFPYKTKRLWQWRAAIDPTRFKLVNENAKLIVVDGPIAVGKTALAKSLAEQFDLHYIPDFTMDEYYTSPYGYDFRNLDPQLPPHMQSMDHRKFCMDPHNENSLFMEITYLLYRFLNYCEAMAHILNTGQGVIMERSYFTDHVMTFSSIDEGYIQSTAREYYDRLIYNTAFRLFRPHLIIYLDIPVPVVQERIKTRGYSYEVNGKALTPSYLSKQEQYYKDYLKQASTNSELLIYDWTDGGEVEGIIEDIEEIDFMAHEHEMDPMYTDWKISRRHLRHTRLGMTNNVGQYIDQFLAVLPYDNEEMWVDPEDLEYLYTLVHEQVPGGRYKPGCNPDQGDKFVYLWNTANPGRRFGLHPFYDPNEK